MRLRSLLALALAWLALTGTAQAQETPPDVNPFNPLVQPTRWDGESRFTVLVMGIDRRPDMRDPLAARTDAILLVSFDPRTDSIGILHIPRDLHFAVPNLEQLLRVNTLVMRGEQLQEGYGPYYAMDTIQYNFGMYVDAFVMFDFEGFSALVDAIGGVEISIDYTINDPTYPDMNYGYDPFFLRAGTHTLDGATALKFARTRHGTNDYVRGARQLQLVMAIGEKATRADVLPRLLVAAPDLLAELGRHLLTDIALEDGLQLALMAARVPLENVRTGAINEATISYFFQQGGTVAIPDREKIGDLLRSVFGDDYSG